MNESVQRNMDIKIIKVGINLLFRYAFWNSFTQESQPLVIAKWKRNVGEAYLTWFVLQIGRI